MKPRANATWFVCTVSKGLRHNFELAKEASVWGIPSHGKNISKTQAKKGDYLVFYLASAGFFAIAELTGPMKNPESKEEAPWAGGAYRYGIVMPIKIRFELLDPVNIGFTNMKVSGTSVGVNALRRGFTRISNGDGELILSHLLKIRTTN